MHNLRTSFLRKELLSTAGLLESASMFGNWESWVCYAKGKHTVVGFLILLLTNQSSYSGRPSDGPGGFKDSGRF